MDDSGRAHRSPPLWSRRRDGVVTVYGEVDISTCGLFRSIVDGVVGEADGNSSLRQAHLDLAGVEFIDVAGTRVLVSAATDPRHLGALVVHHPPAMLARILDSVWGDVALRLDQPRDAPGAPGRDASGAPDTLASRCPG